MFKKLRIAQVAPIWNSIPPKRYGGIERIVYQITEELVKRGHEVTLFATSDSSTSAKLVSTINTPMAGKIPWNNPTYTIFNIVKAYKRAEQFDIIHSHTDYWCFPFASLSSTPTVHTLHNLLPKNKKNIGYQFYKQYQAQNLVSISNNQREQLPWNFMATVYNGIEIEAFPFSPKKGRYLFWAGRITHSKGAKDAILVAKKTQLPLVFAGHLIEDNRKYYENEVKPLLNDFLITSVKTLTPQKMREYYKNALCTLVPIHWEEPFGLVMVESMACGTPVVAYNRGSVSEIIEEGKTGFIIAEKDGVEGIAAAVEKIDQIDRRKCRELVEARFTIKKMVDGYERVYRRILASSD